MNESVAIIIPAHNEAATIADVVSVAVEACPRRVIVVNDGSTDATSSVAKAAGAHVVDVWPNRGKGGAVLAGVDASAEPFIVLLDADLRGLTAEHIRSLVTPVVQGEAVMAVGLRDRGGWISWMRRLPLVGGERAFHRSLITSIPPAELKGFRLEVALNQAAERKGIILPVVLKGVTIKTKVQKVGLLHGLIGYVRMWGEVVMAWGQGKTKR